jgi:uncharacterized protein YecE (DUF72 family)
MTASTSQAPVYLGTSGFSFDDWRGPVYPERIPKAQWLVYYGQQLGFNALEINYTYYQMPSHRTLKGLLMKTTPGFQFAIKAHRSMTHDILQPDRSIKDEPKAFAEFREGMRPLAESGRLACVLTQFPYAFANRAETRDYVRRTMDRLGDLRLVVEFRNKSWVTPETFKELRERKVGFCVVDEPALPGLMPWVPEVTSDLAYVRFHGRNAAQWFGTSGADRYNYLYSDQELRGLVERLAVLRQPGKTLMVFLNNCHAGAAAKNALQLRDLLFEQGWQVTPTAPTQAQLNLGL